MTQETRSIAESARLLERARGLIPGATQTLSKGPTQWVQGVAPSYIARAEGADRLRGPDHRAARALEHGIAGRADR
jgi:hypothetical protein